MKRRKQNSGVTLIEMLIGASLLVIASLMVSRLVTSTSSARNAVEAAAAAKREKVALAKVIRNLFKSRAPGGVLRYTSSPYRIRFERLLGDGSIRAATDFQTICEDTSGTRLEKFKLKQMPLPFCSGLALPPCLFTNARYVIRQTNDPNAATVGGETSTILPNPLAASAGSDEGLKRRPIAALLCVQSETAPVADPNIVPDGNNVRVELILGFSGAGDEIGWEKEEIFLPVRALPTGIRYLSSP